jgi:hypothetical protein
MGHGVRRCWGWLLRHRVVVRWVAAALAGGGAGLVVLLRRPASDMSFPLSGDGDQLLAPR